MMDRKFGSHILTQVTLSKGETKIKKSIVLDRGPTWPRRWAR